MCGRFTLTAKVEDVTELLRVPPVAPYEPRYNIAPSQPVLTLLNDGSRKLTFTHWGLIPAWSGGPGKWKPLINARAETLNEKPSFRAALRTKRCLIPADGFYEWPGGGAKKQPVYIRLKNSGIFAFAGLWDEWQDREGGLILSSVIITTRPNKLIAPLHDRMPVILRPEYFEQWLSQNLIPEKEVGQMLGPLSSKEMQMHTVSAKVNNVRYDKADCIAPAEQQTFKF
ncbi:MAG: SOS response-associated peptidase [Kiritimatiellia bacterium]